MRASTGAVAMDEAPPSSNAAGTSTTVPNAVPYSEALTALKRLLATRAMTE